MEWVGNPKLHRIMFGAFNMRFATSGFNPLSLAPALWLSDTGSDASVWPDLSGNGRNATQATAVNQPAIIAGALNGRQVRRFDGGDDQLTGSRVLTSSNFSAFIVVKGAAQNAKAILCQRASSFLVGRTEILSCSDTGSFDAPRVFFNNGTSYNLNGTGTMLNNTPRMVFINSTATGTTSVRINGGADEILSTGQTWTPENANYVVGNNPGVPSRFFAGDIAEILVFPTALSTENRQAVERYLGVKYAITVA